MNILLSIGMTMVTTMMPRPPQWPLLRRGRPQPGQHKLKDTGRSKRLMTKVSMVSGREPEHPDYQGEKADHQSCRAHTGPRHGQTGYVDANERQAAKNVDGIGTAPGQDSRGRPVRQDFPRGLECLRKSADSTSVPAVRGVVRCRA